MDLLDMLPQLEEIARKINFQPLDDLLVQIRNFCVQVIKHIVPGEPVREGGQALKGYASRMDDLHTQLTASISQLQEVYTGSASDEYNASVSKALAAMQTARDHLTHGAQMHDDLANHFIEALFQQGAMVAQMGFMAFDLGSLVFTAGADAPASVPLAAGDAVLTEGSSLAMDGALDAAEGTLGEIADSAGELGDLAGDLGEDGGAALDSGDALDGLDDGAGDGAGDGGDGGGSGGSGSNDDGQVDLNQLETKVEPSAQGTTVTTGSSESGPYFQSQLSSDGAQYTMKMAYRENLRQYTSDAFAQQFEAAGGNASGIQQLVLENVENEETLAQWEDWGSLVNSPLDKMAQYFADSIGVELGPAEWAGNNIIYQIISTL